MLKKELKPISKRKDKLIRINPKKDEYYEDNAIVMTPKEHSNLLNELLQIKKALDIAKSENYDISSTVKTLTNENGKLSAKNDALKKEINEYNDKISELTAKLSSKEYELENLKKDLKKSHEDYYDLKEKYMKESIKMEKDLLIDSVIKIDEYKSDILEIKSLSGWKCFIKGTHKQLADELLNKINFYTLKDKDVESLPENENQDK